MKFLNRVLICLGFAALLCLSWFLVTKKTPESELQAQLVAEAKVLLEDEIYVRSVPLLEQALGYEGPLRDEIEALLKECYVQLSQKSDYSYRLEELVAKQVAREDAPKERYLEARDYYLAEGEITAAIRALRDGATRLQDPELVEAYEALRYTFELGGKAYQELTMVYNGRIQVRGPEGWGLATIAGSPVVPCQYDWVSTYSVDTVVVMEDGKVYSVDPDGFRTQLYHGEPEALGNFGNGLLALKTGDGWVRADARLQAGTMSFQELGMYNEGYAPAKKGDKWGVIDMEGNWVLQPEYDGIVMDELGRGWAQGAAFVRKDEKVLLCSGGQLGSEVYEDARLFQDGWAAVKKDGKWMFIDTAGQVQLVCGAQDAGSFNNGLAPVMMDGLWGYIRQDGTLVIDPQFQGAKNFTDGYAPVMVDDQWTFIGLYEYKEA